MTRQLKYPVMLVHGMSRRDDRWLKYWGRIPKALEQSGCRIYFSGQDCNAVIEHNADFLAGRIKEILEDSGASKINVIAHSKGGVDIRRCISKYHLEDCVASITTIGTPHHGSKALDRVFQMRRWFVRLVSFTSNIWMRIYGDSQPDFYHIMTDFTTEAAARFNEENPLPEGVYCQSFAFVADHAKGNYLLSIPRNFIKRIEGESDGLVTPASAQWGNFRGIVRSTTRRGVSHWDEIDLKHQPLSKNVATESMFRISDITDFYSLLAKELAEKGF